MASEKWEMAHKMTIDIYGAEAYIGYSNYEY